MHKQLQKWMLALSLLMLGSLNSAYALTSTGASTSSSDAITTICHARWGFCETFKDSTSASPTSSPILIDANGAGQIGLVSEASPVSSEVCLSATGSCNSTLSPIAGSISIGGTIKISNPIDLILVGTPINTTPPQLISIVTPIIDMSPIQPIEQNGYGSGSLTMINAAPIHINLVPEPSSYALLLAGISLFMLRRNTFSR